MSLQKKKEPATGFDEAKIADLEEPIAVTIHRMIGQKPCPITMPLKQGWEVPGHGMTQDEVRCIDSFIASECGGGDYIVTATGSNNVQHKWAAYFPLDKYPEKPVPMTGPQVAQGNGRTSVMVQPPGAPAQFSGVMGGGGMVPQFVQAPDWMMSPGQGYATPRQQQQAPYWAHPGMPPMPSFIGADDKLLAERERVTKLEAQIDRDRMEASHREQILALREELRRLAEGGSARSSESDQVAELRRQLEAERAQRQTDERFSQLQRQIEQQSQQFQTLLTKLSERPTGPDPTMMLLVEAQKSQAEAAREAARIQAEAQKETARIQAEAQKEAARTQLGPREMIDVMTRLAPNHDRTADAFGKIMDLQTRVMENALQMQGPPVNPALEMAGRAAEGILGVAQQYIQMKEQAAKQEAHAKVATAQAVVQAQAIQAQQAQLAAAPPPAAVTAAGEGDAEGDDDEEDDEAAALEEKLFGPALPAVERLRQGVETGALGPEDAAQAVIQGIEHFKQKKEPVEAFGLWQRGNIDELVGVLVPDALDSYKGQMAQALFNARNSQPRA